MNNQQLCVVCRQPMILKPAGISQKTGRAYPAFYACQDISHKQPFRQSSPQATPTPSYQAPSRPPIREDVNWDKISFGKCKHAFLIEQMKAGINLEQAEIEAEKWAKASMRVLGEPQVKSLGSRPVVDQIPFGNSAPLPEDEYPKVTF